MLRRTGIRTSVPVLLVFTMLLSMLVGVTQAAAQVDDDYEVLVFHRTTGFRHDSIPAAISAIEDLGDDNGFAVTDTQDQSVFTDAGLAPYAAVVFITDGQGILELSERAAFERFVRSGGGFVGIHSTANMHTNGDWPWFEQLMGGAYFLNHPSGANQFQNADILVEDATHPATDHLSSPWNWEEEWYNFTANPRDGGVHVLATVDESTYSPGGGSMGADHPIAWCNEYDGGRAFYTGLGHKIEYYSDADFQEHLLGGIEWGAGVVDGDCGEPRNYVPSASDFTKIPLDQNAANPMELKIGNDGKVFFVEIAGAVKVYDPETGDTTIAGHISVHRGNENGLMGIELDPDFDDNGWMYLFYSRPAGNTDAANHMQNLSRFTYDHDAKTIDMDSEELLLEVFHQRTICCHSAGSMVFDSEGYLYVSTGDDTQHADSQGYAPIDGRLQNGLPTPDAQRARDARRSSGNTNDLRGSILRIKPLDDPSGPPGIGNTYDVPEDNLFSPGMNDQLFANDEWDGSLVRQEIYAMGFRNPFHISIDPATDNLWVGDVGPDAGNNNPNRGPMGHDEWNLVTKAGNHGWPFCIADNKAYVPWDFGSGTTNGPAYDCENGPVNDSPHNTGLEQLPPGVEATIYYPYGSPEARFSFVPSGGGRAAYGGPIYQFDPEATAPGAFPPHYDGRHFMLEWSRNWVGSVLIDDTNQVAEGSFEQFMQGTQFRSPHAAEFGPDGNMYMIEWGLDFNYGANGVNADSGIYRIGYQLDAPDPVDPDPIGGDGLRCVVLDVDEFDGDSLGDVWDVVQPNPDNLTVADGSLQIQTEPGFDFHDGGGTLPNVVVRDLPEGAWDAVIDVDWDPTQDFQNGGFVIFSDNDHWIKAGLVHAGGKAFEMFKSLNGNPQALGNFGVPGFPTSYQMRLAYNGTTLTAYGQVDGAWEQIGSTDLAGLDNPRLGVYATNSTNGAATNPPVFSLNSFSLTQAGAPAETVGDEFDGDALDGCRWDRVVRYDEDNLSVGDGRLTLQTTADDILGGTNTAPNLVLQTAPDGDWTVETFMSAELERSFQNAGLLYHQDDDNYLKMGIVSLNDPGSTRNLAFEVATEINGNFSVVNNTAVPDSTNDDYYLRLVKEGNTLTSQRSLDGDEWVTFATADVNFDDAAFGLYAVGTPGQASSVDVHFDYFHLLGEEPVDPVDPEPEAPSVDATLNPTDPDGDNDWYVSPVEVTLDSDDDDAALQWRSAGDSSWNTVTEPLVVDTDGAHDLEYRAVVGGLGGDTPEQADVDIVGFNFADGRFEPDPIQVAVDGDVTFTLIEGGHDVNIADASGDVLESSPYMTTEGETFEFSPTAAGVYYVYCDPHSSTSDANPENWTGMVAQMIVSDTDDEGLASEIGEVSFKIDQTPPETDVSLDGTAAGDAYVDEVTVTLDADDATSGVAETRVRQSGDGDGDVYVDPITITGVGTHTVEYRSIDEAGNVEDWQTVTFEIVDEDDGGTPPPAGSLCENHQGGATFPDSRGSGHHYFIDCLAALEVVGGFTDGTYGPAQSVTREQLASFVVRAVELATGETMDAGGSLFPDVNPGSTHGQAIYKLRNAGIIQGYTDGTFDPRANVTRDQTARYVTNALEWVLDEELETSGARFPDVTSTQFQADIDKLVTAQIIGGFADGTFGPRLDVTRGQMARFIGASLEFLEREDAYQG